MKRQRGSEPCALLTADPEKHERLPVVHGSRRRMQPWRCTISVRDLVYTSTGGVADSTGAAHEGRDSWSAEDYPSVCKAALRSHSHTCAAVVVRACRHHEGRSLPSSSKIKRRAASANSAA
jgi:hypothetical protein